MITEFPFWGILHIKKKINTVMGHHMMSNIKIRILKQTNLTDLADFNGFFPQGLFCNH